VQVCFYHAGCPDGFGAAWAVFQVWGDAARYVPRGHEDRVRPGAHAGDVVAFVDIAPDNDELVALCEHAAHVMVLDHHITARDRFESDPATANAVAMSGHRIVFDLDHSGAVLAWLAFAGDDDVPDLLRYVEDQDLWNWKLPNSREVNAAISSYPHRFEVWSELAARPIAELAREGEPIVRANRVEVERVLHTASPIAVGTRRVEAVNATQNRSTLGHELAKRAAYGDEWGCVYRIVGDRVHATLYSIGDFDVAGIASHYGGGGHRNAAGFAVSLKQWLEDFA